MNIDEFLLAIAAGRRNALEGITWNGLSDVRQPEASGEIPLHTASDIIELVSSNFFKQGDECKTESKSHKKQEGNRDTLGTERDALLGEQESRFIYKVPTKGPKRVRAMSGMSECTHQSCAARMEL